MEEGPAENELCVICCAADGEVARWSCDVIPPGNPEIEGGIGKSDVDCWRGGVFSVGSEGEGYGTVLIYEGGVLRFVYEVEI